MSQMDHPILYSNEKLRTCFLMFQDGDILLTPNSRSDRTQTLLMIPNLQTEDAGIYWCKSRNVWGEVNATFPVKIYGK